MNKPYIRTGVTALGIERDILIAAAPVAAMAIVRFGAGAALILLVCTVSAAVSNILFNFAAKRSIGQGTLGAVITGSLVGLCLPETVPLWTAATGSVIATVVFKNIIGLTGRRYIEPVSAAIAILLIFFTRWATIPISDFIDVRASIIALESGCIGASPAAIAVSFIYLLARRVISPHITLAYLLTFIGLVITLGTELTPYHLFSGRVLLAAVFLAPAYDSSPVNGAGKAVFGIGCGIAAFCFRLYAMSDAGEVLAIVIMNLLSPAIESVTAKVYR